MYWLRPTKELANKYKVFDMVTLICLNKVRFSRTFNNVFVLLNFQVSIIVLEHLMILLILIIQSM